MVIETPSYLHCLRAFLFSLPKTNKDTTTQRTKVSRLSLNDQQKKSEKCVQYLTFLAQKRQNGGFSSSLIAFCLSRESLSGHATTGSGTHHRGNLEI